MTKGLFIVIYGPNNIGKSTQARMVVAWLKEQGYSAEYLKYPIYDSPTGKRISGILREGKEPDIDEQVFQTIYYENRKHFEAELLKKLDAGIFVVAEDYIGTSLAWGTAKGADYDYLKKLNSDLIQEDLAILMDGERFKHAAEKNHIHEQNAELMLRVRDVHLSIGEKLGWPKVNANQTKDEVFDAIRKLVEPILKK